MLSIWQILIELLLYAKHGQELVLKLQISESAQGLLVGKTWTHTSLLLPTVRPLLARPPYLPLSTLSPHTTQ